MAVINDSWEQIIASIDDGTYSTKYTVGDTKEMELGTEGPVQMQIVGFDVDTMGSGAKAPITFISEGLLNTTHAMNSTDTTTGGWESSGMRTYLKETIKPLIPEEIRNHIVTVNKVSSTYENGALVKDGQTTQDDVWIPGDHEVGFGTAYETTGPVYSGIFKVGTSASANNTRIKYFNGSAIPWWLRSAHNSTYFHYVDGSGYNSSYYASSQIGVVLGFCLAGSNINTRDRIGEQATLDGLINNTLTSLEESGVNKLGARVLYNKTALTSVNFPNLTQTGNYSMSGCSGLTSVSMSVTTLGTYTFQNCINLTSIDLPEVNTISNYCFDGCEKLKTVTMPKVTKVNQYAFSGCRELHSVDFSEIINLGNSAIDHTDIGKLELPVCTSLGTYIGRGSRITTVDLTKTINLASNKFNSANGLVELILRGPIMATLTANALAYTGLANGVGYIYVPSDLVDTYKANSVWATYSSQIVPISEYPKRLQNETITDSWSEIFAKENNGSYSTAYSLGDTKVVDVGGSKILMQIVGIDKDSITGGGTAKLTWMSVGIIHMHKMNETDTATGGYASSWMKDYIDGLYDQIESTVKSAIVSVDKTYYDYSASTKTQTASLKTWIPSAREIFGGSSYESSGCDYTEFFTDATSRIKRRGYSSYDNDWWLRSASSANYFRIVSNKGTVTTYSPIYTGGVVLGFCT